jgi:hypothetical protein
MARMHQPPLGARRSLLLGGLAALLPWRRSAFAADAPEGASAAEASALRNLAASRSAGPDRGTPAAPGAAPVRSRHVGVNLAGLAYYANEFPFADLMKTSGGWSLRSRRGGEGGTLRLTPEGWPAALEPGEQAAAAVGWDAAGYPTGEYVVRWDGEGDLAFPGLRGRIVSRAPGRTVIDVRDASSQLWVTIERTRVENPVRNVRFLWPGTEAAQPDHPFNPEFLRRIAPFSVLRFMDWGMTNGSSLVRWSDRAQLDDVTYTRRGAPLELMIELANRLEADPWLCIPHLADDDFVRAFAGMVKERLDPRRVVRIEYSNEVWNQGFEQARWAVAQSKRLGLPTPYGLGSAFYAERTQRVAALFDEVFGAGERRRWRAVLAGQAAWTQFSADALGWKDTAAKVDALAIAPYFQAAGANDPKRVTETLALTPEQVIEQMRASIRGEVRSRIAESARLAQRHKLELVAYEGGAHDTASQFPPDRQDPVAAVLAKAHASPRMREVYREYLDAWVEGGGGVLNQYHDIGKGSKWGFWGALETVTQDPQTAPKYLGLLDAIAAHAGAPARAR